MPLPGWGRGGTDRLKVKIILEADKQYDKHFQGSVEERKLHGGGSIGC